MTERQTKKKQGWGPAASKESPVQQQEKDPELKAGQEYADTESAGEESAHPVGGQGPDGQPSTEPLGDGNPGSPEYAGDDGTENSGAADSGAGAAGHRADADVTDSEEEAARLEDGKRRLRQWGAPANNTAQPGAASEHGHTEHVSPDPQEQAPEPEQAPEQERVPQSARQRPVKEDLSTVSDAYAGYGSSELRPGGHRGPLRLDDDEHAGSAPGAPREPEQVSGKGRSPSRNESGHGSRRGLISRVPREEAYGEAYEEASTGAASQDDEDREDTRYWRKKPGGGLLGRMGSLGGRLSGSRGREQDIPREGADAEKPPPEEVENRLKDALRETVVDGFRRICVGSPKGGVGKSSIAYALAGSLAYYTNLRVCLVDADPDFGSTRMLVPRPVDYSVVDMASDAEELKRLSDLRRYVAKNERMRLDVLLNPKEMAEMAAVKDLGAAYERIDDVLSRFYDVVIYDLGLGFRDPVIRRVLSLCEELLLISDAEVIPNAMLSDALNYIQSLGVDLSHTTLALNHRLPASDESAQVPMIRDSHTSLIRRVTEIPYDPRMSQLLNRRSFHVEDLALQARLGILTTTAATLEGLRRDTAGATEGAAGKVVSHAEGIFSSRNNRKKGA